MSLTMLSDIKKLRKELHQYPELSEQEISTPLRIKEFLQRHSDAKFVENLGGTGLAAIYEFAKSGPAIMIRCELDALPINEVNTFDHKSRHKGVSHKCGHDGHMAIVAGLVFWLKQQHFNKGKVILLFQPAEETGVGAYHVLNDPQFKQLKPDYIFALHNIPGKPLHSIISVENNFSATVQSFSIKLEGKEAHASQPECGINPAYCIAELTDAFLKLNINDPMSQDFTLVTPIYSHVGKKSYGISAGLGEIHYTVRTWSVAHMDELLKNIRKITKELANKHQLKSDIQCFDYFPTVVNHPFCHDLIEKIAQKEGLELIKKEHPFRFGEDFGWFTKEHKAAMFGVGAGIDSPALHHADYDFPEELLETCMTVFQGIIGETLS